jgi:two-component system, NarL family, sensor histidine kinase UhpB
MLGANAALLRLSLSPLRQLTGLMRRVDLLQPGSRLPASGSREVAEVIDVFNATLGRLEDERRSSMSRVLNAQEAERRRIAQELHDQIGQNLTAVLLDAERLGEQLDGEAEQILDDMAALAREILDELRRISYELRPAVLDDLGLASAIEALCSGTGRRAGIDVSHSVDVLVPVLDPDLELTIFRITQEAITNAVRHSGCTSVTVRLAADTGTVTLMVADDGCGPEGAQPGGGIRGMRERAHAIGGRLDITGSPAGGTRVSLRVPTAP